MLPQLGLFLAAEAGAVYVISAFLLRCLAVLIFLIHILIHIVTSYPFYTAGKNTGKSGVTPGYSLSAVLHSPKTLPVTTFSLYSQKSRIPWIRSGRHCFPPR